MPAEAGGFNRFFWRFVLLVVCVLPILFHRVYSEPSVFRQAHSSLVPLTGQVFSDQRNHSFLPESNNGQAVQARNS